MPRTGLRSQLCGDAHLSNFGVYASPDRRLIFDVNDFDETLPGPFEWDVKRLAASFAVAGRDRGFDAKQRESDQPAPSTPYRKAMHELRRAWAHLELWYARIDVEEICSASSGSGRDREGARSGPTRPREDADEGQPAGVREADASSSTASRGSSATRR